MKIQSVLTCTAALAFAAFLSAVALNGAALAASAIAAGAFLALIVAHDYAPARRPLAVATAPVIHLPEPAYRTEERRLAA